MRFANLIVDVEICIVLWNQYHLKFGCVCGASEVSIYRTLYIFQYRTYLVGTIR